MSDTHAPVDFKQQLAAHQQRVNQALLDFIAPLPFGNSNLIEAMRYGAVIGVSVSALSGLCHRANVWFVTRQLRRPGGGN